MSTNLFLVCLVVIALSFPVFSEKTVDEKEFPNCFEDLGRDVKGMYVIPDTDLSACNVECALRIAKLLKDDGRIDKRKFIDYLNGMALGILTVGIIEQSSIVLEKCGDDVDSSGDSCKTTDLLVRCVSRVAKDKKFDEIQTMLTFMAPYHYIVYHLEHMYAKMEKKQKVR